MLQEAEVANSDVDLTADASKISEDDDDMNISVKKEHKTVEYQETFEIDAVNIAKNKQNMDANI